MLGGTERSVISLNRWAHLRQCGQLLRATPSLACPLLGLICVRDVVWYFGEIVYWGVWRVSLVFVLIVKILHMCFQGDIYIL